MSSDDGDLRVNNYAVAFIDVLGQRAALRGCGLLPDSKEEFLPLARHTVGVIQRLHQSFEQFYTAFHETANVSLVSEQHRNHFARQQQTKLKFQRFSDGLVAFVSLSSEENHLPINGVYGLLAAAGALCLLGLAVRQPIRGGMDIAWGAELNDSELYGCAVAKSYELESAIAKYPRIALGQEVIRYLDAHAQSLDNGLDAQYVRALAGYCKEMIAMADDGVHIVDYLGSGFRKYITNSVDASLYTEAAAYVSEQLQYWTEKEDPKLKFRYQQLQAYFNENIDLCTP